ncbi:PREDICTED: zinc finger protein 862-like [Rhagoletis zephyria]|uniref:zinc finger protein 862-like n=1 Tax=Rhagoletis zephyria TaxID=28612 RepID=UPI0008113435|nr:PREDICTED: zinc finger protein 862-like [Rhagoletis zephyria]
MDLEKCTVVQLKNALREAQLKTSGTKEELILRLQDSGCTVLPAAQEGAVMEQVDQEGGCEAPERQVNNDLRQLQQEVSGLKKMIETLTAALGQTGLSGRTMDRFLTKTSNLIPEKDSDVSQTKASCSEDEQKFKRKFRVEWFQQFDWVRDKNGCAFCIACDKTILNHLTHLKNHEKTTFHVVNLERKKKQLSIDKFLGPEHQKFQQQVRDAELTLVMFLITHNLPFLLMDYLPGLLTECCPDSNIAKNIKCGRTKSVQLTEFLSNLASKNIVNYLKQNKFSLIVDETTDVSMKKCLVLVARYVDSVHVVHDRFLAMIELAQADAQTIFFAIKEFFRKYSIPLQNIIGLATDGASVMAGEIGGLKTLLKMEADIFYLKCTCHSLHLCSSYASKKLPGNIEVLCRNIYNYFSHSPKRISELKEFQNYCCVATHKILGISQTRWLSLEGVICKIIEQWESLKLYFISCFLENLLECDSDIVIMQWNLLRLSETNLKCDMDIVYFWQQIILLQLNENFQTSLL